MLVIYAIRRKLTLLVLLNITCLLKCWDQARATEDGLLKPGRRRLLADAEGGEHLLASHDVEEMLHVETKSLNLLQPEGNNMNRKVLAAALDLQHFPNSLSHSRPLLASVDYDGVVQIIQSFGNVRKMLSSYGRGSSYFYRPRRYGRRSYYGPRYYDGRGSYYYRRGRFYRGRGCCGSGSYYGRGGGYYDTGRGGYSGGYDD